MQVSGTVTGPPNVGVVINGERAHIRNGVFLTRTFTLNTAATQLSAVPTAPDGLLIPVGYRTSTLVACRNGLLVGIDVRWGTCTSEGEGALYWVEEMLLGCECTPALFGVRDILPMLSLRHRKNVPVSVS